jgi:hypothetical protein
MPQPNLRRSRAENSLTGIRISAIHHVTHFLINDEKQFKWIASAMELGCRRRSSERPLTFLRHLFGTQC